MLNQSFRVLLLSTLSAMLVLSTGCKKKEKPSESEPSSEVSAPGGVQESQPKEPPTPVETFTGQEGRVLQVFRADMLKIQQNKKKTDVKLYGVVLPVKNAAVMSKAKKFSSNLVMGKKVLVDVKGKDHGKVLAMVSLPPGPNLNHELVREGYAQWDQKSAKDTYAQVLQDQAKSEKKGMWAQAPAPKKKKKK